MHFPLILNIILFAKTSAYNSPISGTSEVNSTETKFYRNAVSKTWKVVISPDWMNKVTA